MTTQSVKDVHRHEVGDITYLIKASTLMSRAAYRRDVATLGASYPSDAAMMECLREGVELCVAEDQRGRLLELIDSLEFENRQRAEAVQAGDTLDVGEDYTDLVAQVAQIEAFMRREYARYAQMESDRRYWLDVAPIVAFRHFVTGWEGSDVKPEKTPQGILIEAVLDRLPEGHVSSAGWKAIGLLRPTKDEEKNSESRPSSPADRETSSVDDTLQTEDPVGRSAA